MWDADEVFVNVRRLGWLACGSVLLGACWVCLAQGGARLLTLDGQVVSRGIQMDGDRALVPLADVAALMDRRVITRSGTFDLVPIASGKAPALPIALQQGGWQLTVRKVRTVARYTPRFSANKDEVVSPSKSDVLILVDCRLHNETREMQNVYFDRDTSGNTALRDDTGRGYVPLAYDSRNSEYSSNKLPSGTLHDFVIVFSVPKGTRMKSLVYTVNGVVAQNGADFVIGLG